MNSKGDRAGLERAVKALKKNGFKDFEIQYIAKEAIKRQQQLNKGIINLEGR
jgi:hypothetical protein